MATTYELRKALYKTIEDTAILSAGVKQAQIISFVSAPFAVELYVELSTYRFNLEISSDGKYSVNLIDFNGGLDTFSFVINGNSILIKSNLDLNGLKVRKEIKYGVIANPSIEANSTSGLTWISIESTHTTQLESLVVDGDIEVTGTVDINNSTSIDGANIHLGGTIEVDVVTPLLDINSPTISIEGLTSGSDSIVTITGELNVDDINIKDTTITSTGPLVINSTTNSTTIQDDVSITQALDVSGETNLAASTIATNIRGNLNVTEETELNSTLGVDGDFRVGNAGAPNFTVSESGEVYTLGNLEVDGATQLDGTLTVTGTNKTTLNGDLEVDGSTILDGTVGINDDLTISNTNTNITSSEDINLLLEVNSNDPAVLTIDASNSGTGTAAIAIGANESITMVSGSGEFTGSIGINSDNIILDGSSEVGISTPLLNIDATNINITGDSAVKITGSLDVDNINIDGNTVKATNVSANPNLVLDSDGGTVEINDNVDVTGTLSVSSISTFTENINADGGLDVNDLLDIDTSGNLETSGIIKTTNTTTSTNPSTGAITVTGGVGIGGAVNSTGSITSVSTLQGTRLISTVATGTSPLTVSSKTKVVNLNADLLDDETGADFHDWSKVTGKTTPVINLDGDLGGSVSLTTLGDGPFTLTATIQEDSVALGTDTTGNYVATIENAVNGGMVVTGSGSETAAVKIALALDDVKSTLTDTSINTVGTDYHTHAITNYDVAGTANQITVSGLPKVLGSAATLSLPQDIHTGANPTFAGATLGNIEIAITGNDNTITTKSKFRKFNN